MSNLRYNEPKAPIFTEEERLLDTPALAFYNPEYEDTQAPDYKPSALQEATRLDESLWRNSANGWALYNQFANMQQGTSQDDPLGWMTMMASLSPNTTSQQKEAASTMYQLFAPQDGDYSYHGLNFAAYGGKVNRFGLGDKMYNIAAPSDQTAQVAGLPMIQRQIAAQTGAVKATAKRRAVDPRLKPQERQKAARDYTSIRVNEMKKAAEESGTPFNSNFAELALSDEFRREQELFNKEMQEQQGTISAPTTIQAPLHTLGTQPGLDAAYTSYAFNPTQYNQSGYLGGVAATGKADRALGASMLAGTIGARLPSFAPGTAGGNLIGETAGSMAMGELLNEGSRALTGRDWGENLRYGLEGTADMLGLGYNPESWSPFAQGAYSFLTDMTNPGYYKSRWLRNGFGAAQEGVNALRSNIYNMADANLKGNNFTSRLVLDTLNPDVSIWNATKNGSYPWTHGIQSNRINELTQIAENAKDDVLSRVQQSIIGSQHLKPNLTIEEI